MQGSVSWTLHGSQNMLCWSSLVCFWILNDKTFKVGNNRLNSGNRTDRKVRIWQIFMTDRILCDKKPRNKNTHGPHSVKFHYMLWFGCRVGLQHLFSDGYGMNGLEVALFLFVELFFHVRWGGVSGREWLLWGSVYIGSPWFLSGIDICIYDEFSWIPHYFTWDIIASWPFLKKIDSSHQRISTVLP